MKKTHDFRELSNKMCDVSGCNKRLKERLVESKEPHNITKCYKHYVLFSGAMPSLVKQIKEHALEHYNDGGWDYIVESYSDAEIAEIIKGSFNLEEAIKKITPIVEAIYSKEQDARCHIF